MHRLFIAIRPPADIRARLLSVMGGVPGARWQDDDQLHLTLRFVGETDPRRADDLAAALATIRFAPFPIALSGVGQFDRRGRIDALWASVQPRDALTQLHRKIDRACVDVGFPGDQRAYLPHITLARFSRSGSVIDSFLSHNAALSSPPFLIDSFILFESHLTQAGARYDVAAVYPADPQRL